MTEQATTITETIDVRGGHLVEKVKDLLHEGNVRRIIINDTDGKTVVEVPVTVGLVGFIVAPTMAAVAALAALAADYTIQVERETSDNKTRETTMERYRSLLDRYVELYNEGDVDGIMELYGEDAVQLMPDGTFEGQAAIRERLARELPAFPDVHWDVLSYVEDGDAFCDEWVFVGTHTGPFPLPDGTELPATGKRVELRGMEYVLMRDGKIVVDNLYYDNMAIAAQLGLLPQTATA